MSALRIALTGPWRPRPNRLLTNKAHSSAAIRSHLRRRGITTTIPVPADQIAHRTRRGSNGGRSTTFDPDAYRQRNTVERTIHKLKAYRAIAMRTDKRALVFAGTVQIASIRIWLRDLTKNHPTDTP